MTKYVLLYLGFEANEGGMDAWQNWFAGLGDKVVDTGNPFSDGFQVVGGVVSKPGGMGPADISGYSIVNADSLADAETIAKSCPSVGGVKVMETTSM